MSGPGAPHPGADGRGGMVPPEQAKAPASTAGVLASRAERIVPARPWSSAGGGHVPGVRGALEAAVSVPG